jgi:hypothetical protein
MNEDNEIKEIVIELMLEKIRVFYPNVYFCYNRLEFSDGSKCKIPDQVVRDSFPLGFELNILSSIAGWRVAEMNKTPMLSMRLPMPKVFKKDLMDENQQRECEVKSLQILSQYQLSTSDISESRKNLII